MASTSPVRGSSATTAPRRFSMRQLGDCLQIQVDGELQILSGNGFLVVQHVALVAETVHFHALLAVHAHQLIVVLALDAVLADDVALVEAGELGRVQFRFADFADVPDDMRRHTVARIKAVLHAHHFEFGERAGVLVRIDEGQFARASALP